MTELGTLVQSYLAYNLDVIKRRLQMGKLQAEIATIQEEQSILRGKIKGHVTRESMRTIVFEKTVGVLRHSVHGSISIEETERE